MKNGIVVTMKSVVMPVMAMMLVMAVMPVIVVMMEENSFDEPKLHTTSDIKISLYGTPLSGKTLLKLL